MTLPFRVGEKYRNRKGAYQVVSIDGDRMVIHYLSGGTLTTTITDQQRIWENMSAEDSVQPAPQTGTKPSISSPRKPVRSRREREFKGLSETDFKDNVASTSWRARESLGGLLAEEMTLAKGGDYQSWSVYRVPEVHVAQPTYYSEPDKARESKFRFRLTEDAAWYGFYIEHYIGEEDKTWDWWRFLRCIERNEAVQRQVENAMRQQDLHWAVWPKSDQEMNNWLRTEERDGGSILRHTTEGWEAPFTWTHFVTILKELPANTWFGVFLHGYTPKAQAIAKGLNLAGDVVAVWKALEPLYLGSIR